MPRPDLSLETLGPARFREAAGLAARAFAADPLYAAAAPTARRRARAAGAIAAFYLRYGRRYGRNLGAVAAGEGGGRLLGFSIWLPPEVPDLTPLRSLLTGALALSVQAHPADLARLARIDPPAARAKEADAPFPVRYLLLLAVEPEAQGRGVGRALLEGELGAFDAAGEPAYLETQRPENAAYYRRFGFELASRRPVPGLPGVEHLSMLRPPAAAGRADGIGAPPDQREALLRA